MMPSCREVTRAIAADELASASVWRRISVRLHLLLCVHCSNYARQLAALGAAARRLGASPPRHDAGLGELEKSLVGRLSAPTPGTKPDGPDHR